MNILEDVIKANNLSPLTNNLNTDKIQQSIEEHKMGSSKITVPVNSRVKEKVEKIKN